ncbi:MAG: type pili sensor histidine kinase and response regulator [Steroidobacteraceae bacterium]|jgi:chemosensory pili system protein ChpA (sensor histidine kinase/response regulator)|nr:type pili sensor histidine kinase and response regulator [Steroidobacteraceae bacterium]
MPEVASQTLDLVGRELNNTLGEARTALETFVEQPENVVLLQRCVSDLHQVQGVLRLLEIFGAALLAEEMEQVTQYLLTPASQKNQAETLDALMRAMVQLPSYVERVLAGGRDLALVLLPLLNDLRAVRGSPLLSEGTLLLLNLKSDQQAAPVAPSAGEQQLSVAQWARRLRTRFQLGLVGWIRGERPEQNLEILETVAHQLEQVATRQPVFQLWWVVGAIIEALREGGLETGVSIKRLLGLADREILQLYTQGEGRYAQNPPVELLNNLLYYAARATTDGPKVTAVRASFRLNELLMVDDSVEQERENLSAPSVKLMHTVSAAIREDLGKVKDVLDIYVRRGGQPAELEAQVGMLRKIGDTLGVLGLGELRQLVLEETSRLEAMAAGKTPADHAALVHIAATLINVEDRLDRDLIGLIVPKAPPAEGEAEASSTDVDFQQVQAAVLRECSVNLVRVKEAIASNVAGTLDVAALDAWPGLIQGIKAGLLMLGKTRAVEIVEGIAKNLKELLQPGGTAVPPNYLDRLADAVVSLEYYMETLQAGRADPWYMLDNAQTCLLALSQMPKRVVPTVPPLGPEAYAATVLLADAGATARAHALQAGVVPHSMQGAPTLHTSAQPPIGAAKQVYIDPELLALYIEEAREEVARIAKLFPSWEQNPLETEALAGVRRAFHTLKGSGRMVGATDIAEFAWAIENLLNRVIDNTLQRSPSILATVRDATAIAGELVNALEANSPAPSRAQDIVDRAHALAANKAGASAPSAAMEALERTMDTRQADVLEATGRVPTLQPPPSPPVARAAVPPVVHPSAGDQAPPADESIEVVENWGTSTDDAPGEEIVLSAPEEEPSADLQLKEIYSRETQVNISAVLRWVEGERNRNSPHVVSEECYRACHTLSGSSRMAEARHGIRLTAPLEHWVRKSFDSGVGLEAPDLGLLADCMTAMGAVASHLDESTGFFQSHSSLLARIEAATEQLEGRIIAAARAAELAAAPPPVPPANVAPAVAAPSAPFPAAEKPVVSQAPAPAADVAEDVLTDFDPDIASIFTDEAVELIDASQSALAQWNENRGSVDGLTALKRPLHTLKGGARMAGLMPMGDLAHELETLFMQIDSGVVAPDDRAFGLAQSALDELARMRESVSSGKGCPTARGLIARIHGLFNGGGAAAAAPAPAVVSAPVPAPAPVHAPPVVAAPAPAPAPAPVPAPVAVESKPEPEVSVVSAPPAPVKPAAPAIAAVPTPATLVAPPPRVDPAPEPPVLAPVWAPDTSGSAEQVVMSSPSLYERSPSEPAPFVATATQIEPISIVTRAPAREPVSAGFKKDDGGDAPLLPPGAVPPGREPTAPSDRPELARVDAELLDQLLNNSGEASIARARLEQQIGSIDFNVGELSRTVTRLKEQLRKLELETEAQILHRYEEEKGTRGEFDPLELDRYSSIQQFSRALAETANDVGSIQGLLENLTKDTQNLLTQQARTITELQNGLMRTRMVPFQRHVQRLARIVRQAATDTHKKAELQIEGASGELDRQVLERMMPPFEHMLRNAVAHGIETPEVRKKNGKGESGTITIALHREGSEVVVEVSDDGAGMNLKAIRDKGISLGMVRADQQLSDDDIMQLILEPGFSTAGAVSTLSGRGVGMDVVASEIKKLGGALHMESKQGQGSKFVIRLPLTLAISHALILRANDEFYALPLPTVEGVVRLSRTEVEAHLGPEAPPFEYGGQKYKFQHLAFYVGREPGPLPDGDVTVPVILVRAGEHSTGLVTDELVGSREIVVKNVGPQIAAIRGISGATILGDGRIVIILDIGALVRADWRARTEPVMPREKTDTRSIALVVDDSITVRRVTQRLLERNGMRVLTARDGVDAMEMLQEHTPDIILLDIEMPRMDGYEVATQVRADSRLSGIPIIMITSRVGEKHRARAIEIGVDDYLGKPYQEAQLLEAIEPLIARRREAHLREAN